MAPFVCTDNEVMVDTVITAKKLVGERLPSYGRDLVPYFIPGASQMDEKNINTNTDVDAHRRAGGGILDIPKPTISAANKTKRQQRKSKSPSKQAGHSRGVSRSQSGQGLSRVGAKSCSDDKVSPSGGRAVLSEPWAGPAFVNSPPPSSLPVPSFVKGVQKQASIPSRPEIPLVAQSESASPLRMGKLFQDGQYSLVQDSSRLFVERAAVEFSLKRILQVA